jgi:cell division septal protein FtsQ
MGWKSFFKRFQDQGAKKLLNRKKNTLTSVGGRAAEVEGRRKNRTVLAILLLIFGVLTATVLWLAVQKAADVLLFSNPEYRIGAIDIISDGQRVSRDKVKLWAEIETGMNIHDINIGRMQAKLMGVPVIKSVEIARVMPDRVVIRLSERMPIASVGLMGLKGVDQTGFVFAISPSRSAMPVITGFMEDPRPGTQLQGRMLNAVEVVDLLNRTTLGGLIHVNVLDVRDPDCLLLRLAEVQVVPLKWADMAMSTPESRLALDSKLKSLARVIEDARMKNQRLAKVDMTFNDDYIPVEYAR